MLATCLRDSTPLPVPPASLAPTAPLQRPTMTAAAQGRAQLATFAPLAWHTQCPAGLGPTALPWAQPALQPATRLARGGTTAHLGLPFPCPAPLARGQPPAQRASQGAHLALLRPAPRVHLARLRLQVPPARGRMPAWVEPLLHSCVPAQCAVTRRDWPLTRPRPAQLPRQVSGRRLSCTLRTPVPALARPVVCCKTPPPVPCRALPWTALGAPMWVGGANP